MPREGKGKNALPYLEERREEKKKAYFFTNLSSCVLLE